MHFRAVAVQDDDHDDASQLCRLADTEVVHGRERDHRALGAPRDVANTVLFLASDEARFLTGVEIPVDNGLFARPSR